MVGSREKIRQMQADGFTIPEIVELTGLRRTTVYRHLSNYNERRRAQLAKKRRERGVRMNYCGICERPGHNARSHK